MQAEWNIIQYFNMEGRTHKSNASKAQNQETKPMSKQIHKGTDKKGQRSNQGANQNGKHVGKTQRNN